MLEFVLEHLETGQETYFFPSIPPFQWSPRPMIGGYFWGEKTHQLPLLQDARTTKHVYTLILGLGRIVYAKHVTNSSLPGSNNICWIRREYQHSRKKCVRGQNVILHSYSTAVHPSFLALLLCYFFFLGRSCRERLFHFVHPHHHKCGRNRLQVS